jgi:hypothetical protein
VFLIQLTQLSYYIRNQTHNFSNDLILFSLLFCTPGHGQKNDSLFIANKFGGFGDV